MAVLVGRGLLDRAHFVQVDLEAATCQLESRLATSKAASDYAYTLMREVAQFVTIFRYVLAFPIQSLTSKSSSDAVLTHSGSASWISSEIRLAWV